MADDNAPGWDAIEATVTERLDVFEEPLHSSTGVLPGQDGVYGVSAYRVPGWWFFVTFGLTELYERRATTRPSAGGASS